MRRALAFLTMALVLASCGGGAGDGTDGSGSTSAARPESPATITILSPKNGEVVKGTSTQVDLKLEGGKIVDASVTKITPTTGHVHVQLDGKIVAMTSGLTQELTGLTPGTHRVRIEFVAADHGPFDPRVFDEIAFTVK